MHDNEDTSEKTFANTCKKNPKDDDIPATEQNDEDANKVNSEGPRRAILEALMTRFQDTYDLATMEKKLSKLSQKPEENCRAFVSRLNNLYDTITGKEERADHNQTIIEGQLLNKLKKMRDHRKSKILLQGLLAKSSRRQGDVSCHSRDNASRKQQIDKIQLLEQKLSEALSELKCTNTKRGSSQENDVTMTATDQYEKEDQVQVNATQDHVIREYDLLTVVTAENQVEKEV
ncbi:hypothetical protein OUZ56_018839 [Daphnia magna]|uniref:Retrotransposon gag domain-containing protein n=1 Tax=Daphnia magna TaxID=35525 RepID=A0ABQ9ZA30_9CRUS|nr:hypothetical protein OUZ56_018839 [Daphnia magna]